MSNGTDHLDDSPASQRIREVSKRFPLNTLLKHLKQPKSPSETVPGLDDLEIGIAYAAITLQLPPECYLSLVNSTNFLSEKTTKKLFQEGTRLGLYQLVQHLEVGERPFSEFREDYEETIARNRNGLIAVDNKVYQLLPDTIEYHVQRLARENEAGLLKLGQAIQLGAAARLNEIQDGGKRFIEYHAILEQLNLELTKRG